jgi:hypothetical protein
MAMVGPFIRCLSEKISSSLRSSILSTLLILCEHYQATAIRPFIPQLQRCFCKSLVVSKDALSAQHFLASSLIPHTAIRCLLSIATATPKPDLIAPDLSLFLTSALYPVLETLNTQSLRDEETYVDPDLVFLGRHYMSLVERLAQKDPSLLDRFDDLRKYVALLKKLSILQEKTCPSPIN